LDHEKAIVKDQCLKKVAKVKEEIGQLLVPAGVYAAVPSLKQQEVDALNELDVYEAIAWSNVA